MIDLEKAVARHRRRQSRARRRTFWQSLGMLGAIGWTVVLPALLGLALGAWLEQARNLTVSCKLPGLLAGLLFGCGAAWQRVRQEWLSLKREEESADEL